MLKLFEATISVAKANMMAGNTSVSLKGKFNLSFPITPSRWWSATWTLYSTTGFLRKVLKEKWKTKSLLL